MPIIIIIILFVANYWFIYTKYDKVWKVLAFFWKNRQYITQIIDALKC